jgi:AraC-like DNA-binding protein
MRTVEETKDQIKKAIQKQINSGETINIREISRKVGASKTTAQRVFTEFFKDNPNVILGKNRNATKIVDKIISEGETDVDKIKKIALDKYKINVADRTIQQKVNVATDLSVPEYEKILRNIVNDKTYKPPIDISAAGKGLTANYRQAKNNLKEEIPNLQTFIDQSSAKRKKLKRASIPEKREMDLISAQMRRDKRRFSEKGKIGLSERELDLNKQQRTVLKRVNDIINNNPGAILEDKELLDKISTRVDREGNIYKAKIDLSAVVDPKKGARFFNLSHGKRVQLGGELLNAPANRFAAPFSINQFFVPDAEKFIEKNYNNPEAQTKINDIVEKAKELKVPLRPDVPKGIFKNEAGNPVRFIGYTENLNKPVEKIIDVVKTYTPKGLNKFTLPIIAGTALIGTAQAKTPSSVQDTQTAMQDQVVEGQAPEPKLASPIKYDSYAGFVNPEDPNEKVSQSDLLYWIADNEIPEEVQQVGKMVGEAAAVIGGATVGLGLPDAKKTIEEARIAGKSPVKGVLGKGFYRLGSPLATAAFTVPQLFDEDTTFKDIGTDPLNYLGLATMETLGKRAGTIAAPTVAAEATGILGAAKRFATLKNVGEAAPGKLNAALRLGLNPRVIAGASRFLGIPGLIASTGYSLYDYLSNKDKETQ